MTGGLEEAEAELRERVREASVYDKTHKYLELLLMKYSIQKQERDVGWMIKDYLKIDYQMTNKKKNLQVLAA